MKLNRNQKVIIIIIVTSIVLSAMYFIAISKPFLSTQERVKDFVEKEPKSSYIGDIPTKNGAVAIVGNDRLKIVEIRFYKISPFVVTYKNSDIFSIGWDKIFPSEKFDGSEKLSYSARPIQSLYCPNTWFGCIPPEKKDIIKINGETPLFEQFSYEGYDFVVWCLETDAEKVEVSYE